MSCRGTSREKHDAQDRMWNQNTDSSQLLAVYSTANQAACPLYHDANHLSQNIRKCGIKVIVIPLFSGWADTPSGSLQQGAVDGSLL